MYKKLLGDTVVSFMDGTGSEVRLNRASYLQAIENIKANRDEYASTEAYERNLEIYLGAARFMGWID